MLKQRHSSRLKQTNFYQRMINKEQGMSEDIAPESVQSSGSKTVTENNKDLKVGGKTLQMYSEEEILSKLDQLLEPTKATVADLTNKITSWIGRMRKTESFLQHGQYVLIKKSQLKQLTINHGPLQIRSIRITAQEEPKQEKQTLNACSRISEEKESPQLKPKRRRPSSSPQVEQERERSRDLPRIKQRQEAQTQRPHVKDHPFQ